MAHNIIEIKCFGGFGDVMVCFFVDSFSYGMLFTVLGFGYFLGSIPFGLLISRASGMPDIRTIGSGNIGATNVLRTGRKGLALLTLLCDGGKAIVAGYIAGLVFDVPLAGALAGAMAVIGHCFPVWLRFKGGKGVATFFGLLIVLNIVLAVLAGFVWLLVAAFSRYSSLGALCAVGTSAGFGFVLLEHKAAFVLLFVCLLIGVRHHDNIKRLLRREETKIGKKDG